MEIMHILDQHHNNLKTEFTQIIEEKHQMMEQKQFTKQQEMDHKIEQLLFMMMSLTRDIQQLNYHLKSEEMPILSDSD